MNEQIKVFICYAKDDVTHAEDLFRKLTSSGADAWIDKHRLALGDPWESRIRNAIDDADAFVVCLSPEYARAGYRHKEIRWALDAQSRRPIGDAFIIPFVIRPCQLPDWCKPFHAGGETDRPTSFKTLLSALKLHFGQRFFPERFLASDDYSQLEVLADALSGVGGPNAIDALIYRLGDFWIQGDEDLASAVCEALVNLGVMQRYGSADFAFLDTDALTPNVREMIEHHRGYIPRKYFDSQR